MHLERTLHPVWRPAALLVACAALAVSPAARADVVESSPAGFVVRHVLAIAAPPGRVYDAIVCDVGRWWEAGHTFSGDPENLSIDPTPGGCFCERWPP